MTSSKTPAKNADQAVTERPNALQALNREMAFRAKMEGDSSESRVNAIAAILAAETDEEFWDADDRDSIGGRDLIDVEQRIMSFTCKKSRDAAIEGNMFRDPETNEGLYLEVCSVRLDTGEEIVWNTSAPGLVAKIIGMQKRDMIPYDVVIRGTNVSNGTVLKLKPVPKRAVPGKVA